MASVLSPPVRVSVSVSLVLASLSVVAGSPHRVPVEVVAPDVVIRHCRSGVVVALVTFAVGAACFVQTELPSGPTLEVGGAQ